MHILSAVNWDTLLIPSMNLWEVFLRGTFMYLMLFALLRVLRRQAGTIGIADLLVVVLIADAAQSAMSGEYKSITEGALLVATIAFWDYALDWLGYHVPFIQKLLRPAPLLLIKDGRLQRRHLRQELITVDELKGLLREQGVEGVEEVKKCFLEGDGHVSVVRIGGR